MKDWRETVHIQSRDYWFIVTGFLQQNWALIDELDEGVIVWFLGDTAGVFDEMRFASPAEATAALKRNGFQRYAQTPSAQEIIPIPEPPFWRRPHPSGPIYSSGRFWRSVT